MFSEILKIKPKLDEKDLQSVERTLNTRFARIAKKFGGGIKNVLMGGGIAGLAIGLIDKILNPLQEVQESIDRTLKKGDDLATYAEQFNTSAGNLARLQAFGQATGLEPEGVRVLLGKFQAAVSQAAADPGKPSAVAKFVGRTDTAEAFFEFVQSMQKLTPTSRNLVQQEVFGERQILKSAEFLNANFAKLAVQIGGPTSEELTKAAKKIADLSDKADIMASGRGLIDLKTKGDLLGESNILEIEKAARMDLARENKRLASFDDLKRIAMASDKIVKVLEDGYLKLAPILGQVLPMLIKDLGSAAKAVEKSRSLRGMIPGKGDE